jgi:hypothetical protein
MRRRKKNKNNWKGTGEYEEFVRVQNVMRKGREKKTRRREILKKRTRRR